MRLTRLAKDLSKVSGGNATGNSIMAVDLSGKRLELLKEAVPNLSRVALLVDPTVTFKEPMIKSHQAAS
jgi:putative ABC transport system substrate-binding protein